VNAPIAEGQHDLTDVTASILDHFGLPPAQGMLGSSFLRAGGSDPREATPGPEGPAG
jgi:hypothetical protein